MQNISQEQSYRTRIEDEFRDLLASKWTRRVACQNECWPPNSCSCRRTIVHVHALEAWWKKPASEGAKQTKAHRFLEEMRLPPHLVFPLNYQEILTGEQSCLRVLSLLITQGRGHLIDRFYYADMNDRYLVRSASDTNLRESLLGIKTLQPKDVDVIVEEFHRDKWAYCPMNLTLYMHANLHETKVIPPFCVKIRLTDKGGTASIYWVAVQKDLISDDALAYALRNSVYYDEDFGECYCMVLKSFCGNKKHDFELEKQAFSGLHSREDVPIVQYLGSYTHDYGEGEEMGKTYNLLLEAGDRDLYQSWADETNVPPVRAQEILRTWNSIFEVAKAIRHVHHPVLRRGGRRPWKFNGWHADIKPDNILSIRGKLKLADFGFSSFAPVLEGEHGSVVTKRIRGFTDTYGAPELYRMKNPDGTLSGVSQTIDIWSFGCVLSVTATWIVLGFQGVRQYELLRQSSPANRKDGNPHDRFHDGSDVLPEIRQWHNFLRGHLRHSDTTTGEVLTLIENNLLKASPTERPDSEELCKMLEHVQNVAESQIASLQKHSRDADDMVLKALAEMEERAQTQKSQDTKADSKLLQLAIPPGGISQANPRKRASMQSQKKEIIKSKPLGQTAYRKETIKQELGTGDPGPSATNPGPQGHSRSIEQTVPTLPSLTHMSSVQQYSHAPRPYTPESMATEYNTHLKQHAKRLTIPQSNIPTVEVSAPEGYISDDGHMDEPLSAATDPISIGTSSDTTTQLEPVDYRMTRSFIGSYSDRFPREEQSMGSPRSAVPLESIDDMESILPPVLDLKYDICQRRRILDKEKSRGLIKKMSSKMGMETRARDDSLEETFIDHRELVFVIDNGWTMFDHWPILTFVAETLALNVAGVDRNGIDIRFTVDGDTHDRQRLKGDSGRQKLKKALKAAWPEPNQKDNATTNMSSIFNSIYKEWKRNGKRAMTLYVFTDGEWTNANPSAIHATILDFAKHDKKKTGNRHFSIQFIRFGENELAKQNLEYLDDTLCTKHNLRDIIDHCSWRAPVAKILKGSIEGVRDQHRDDEPAVEYEYAALVERFRSFNTGATDVKNGEPTTASALGLTLSPSLSRSPSRISSRSSTSTARKRESFHVETVRSRSKRFSGPAFSMP